MGSVYLRGCPTCAHTLSLTHTHTLSDHPQPFPWGWSCFWSPPAHRKAALDVGTDGGCSCAQELPPGVPAASAVARVGWDQVWDQGSPGCPCVRPVFPLPRVRSCICFFLFLFLSAAMFITIISSSPSSSFSSSFSCCYSSDPQLLKTVLNSTSRTWPGGCTSPGSGLLLPGPGQLTWLAQCRATPRESLGQEANPGVHCPSPWLHAPVWVPVPHQGLLGQEDLGVVPGVHCQENKGGCWGCLMGERNRPL